MSAAFGKAESRVITKNFNRAPLAPEPAPATIAPKLKAQAAKSTDAVKPTLKTTKKGPSKRINLKSIRKSAALRKFLAERKKRHSVLVAAASSAQFEAAYDSDSSKSRSNKKEGPIGCFSCKEKKKDDCGCGEKKCERSCCTKVAFVERSDTQNLGNTWQYITNAAEIIPVAGLKVVYVPRLDASLIFTGPTAGYTTCAEQLEAEAAQEGFVNDHLQPAISNLATIVDHLVKDGYEYIGLPAYNTLLTPFLQGYYSYFALTAEALEKCESGCEVDLSDPDNYEEVFIPLYGAKGEELVAIDDRYPCTYFMVFNITTDISPYDNVYGLSDNKTVFQPSINLNLLVQQGFLVVTEEGGYEVAPGAVYLVATQLGAPVANEVIDSLVATLEIVDIPASVIQTVDVPYDQSTGTYDTTQLVAAITADAGASSFVLGLAVAVGDFDVFAQAIIDDALPLLNSQFGDNYAISALNLQLSNPFPVEIIYGYVPVGIPSLFQAAIGVPFNGCDFYTGNWTTKSGEGYVGDYVDAFAWAARCRSNEGVLGSELIFHDRVKVEKWLKNFIVPAGSLDDANPLQGFALNGRYWGSNAIPNCSAPIDD